MSDPSSQEYRNIKVLVTMFGELDNFVIEVSREAYHARTPLVPITEGDLCIFEHSRQDYYNSKYGVVNTIFEGDIKSQPIWQSAMLSIIESGSWAIGTRDESSWRFHLT